MDDLSTVLLGNRTVTTRYPLGTNLRPRRRTLVDGTGPERYTGDGTEVPIRRNKEGVGRDTTGDPLYVNNLLYDERGIRSIIP